MIASLFLSTPKWKLQLIQVVQEKGVHAVITSVTNFWLLLLKIGSAVKHSHTNWDNGQRVIIIWIFQVLPTVHKITLPSDWLRAFAAVNQQQEFSQIWGLYRKIN